MTVNDEILYPSSDGDYYCGDIEETPDEQEIVVRVPAKVCTVPAISLMLHGPDAPKVKGNRQITLKEVKR
jgi:hypothetical protein